MENYSTIASDEAVQQTQTALAANGMKVTVVPNKAAAAAAVLDLIPKGAEIMAVTSKTLEALGLVNTINESGDYDAVMPKLQAMYGDPSKKGQQRKLGAAPDYVIGSVHAVTQNGEVLIASNTGSQLPAYAYGAGTVIWVVGAQKIVRDLAEATKRLTEYVFPLEDARAKVAYGGHGSHISKTLTIHREIHPGRIIVIIVKEPLGY
jgi:hypothetical protein